MLTILAVLTLLEIAMMCAVALTARYMDAPRKSDAMIVLGGGLNPKDGTPLSTLAYRLDRAAQLYNDGYAPDIIVSGGQGRDEPMSEAQSMFNYLTARGIPADSIFREDQSTNTAENMAFSKRIMDERGCTTALIVTSDYHLWRAVKLAERAGIRASGAGSRNSSALFFTLKNLARETLSWIKFGLNI